MFMENILLDMHTHSSFSPDAEDSALAMCERAAELGMKAYSLTDHCDINYWYPTSHYFGDTTDVIDAEMYGSGKYALESIAEQMLLKEKMSGRLYFSIGVEMGQPLSNIEKAEQLASEPGLDFIIGSHHMNKGVHDFYYLKYDEMTEAEINRLLTDCFAQTLEMCKWGRFDVLGHLTYPLRYICGEYGIHIDISDHIEIIREIFCTLISNGKGIEINTSGLRQKYGVTFPSLDLIKLYRELGGEILTIGSDAHHVSDIGAGIREGIELAKAAGFDRAAYYIKHEPEFLKL